MTQLHRVTVDATTDRPAYLMNDGVIVTDTHRGKHFLRSGDRWVMLEQPRDWWEKPTHGVRVLPKGVKLTIHIGEGESQ
jgi:hypothetical protein